jgi:hypothetical protein
MTALLPPIKVWLIKPQCHTPSLSAIVWLTLNERNLPGWHKRFAYQYTQVQLLTRFCCTITPAPIKVGICAQAA